MVERIVMERRNEGPDGGAFDIALLGLSDPADRSSVGRFAEAGATWWLESLSPMRGSLDDLVAVVEAGPPTG
jgi:hypothetical protein